MTTAKKTDQQATPFFRRRIVVIGVSTCAMLVPAAAVWLIWRALPNVPVREVVFVNVSLVAATATEETTAPAPFTHLKTDELNRMVQAIASAKLNALSADLSEVKAAVEQLDWVRRADVRRRLPDKIEVRIEEHVPFGIWRGLDSAKRPDTANPNVAPVGAVAEADIATIANETDVEDEVAPSWTRDGAAVMFGARLAGGWQLMKLNPSTGARTQVTTSGGYAGQESPDGRSILFTRLEEPGVWTMPATGGTPRLLVPAVRAAEYANFRVTTHGIFYVGVTADQVVVRKAPLTGGPGADVAWLGNYSWPGFTVTPDGARVLYAHWDRRESNIMAIDSK